MANTSEATVQQLTERVQHNCNISDALFARNYSLCIYLLKMREFYRWEKGFAYRDSLPKSPLGEWLTAREQLWEQIEEEEYHPLTIDTEAYQPFESEAINQQLADAGLIYSGGYCGQKPHFFLAELEKRVDEEGATVYVAGRELAREITAPPALSLGDTIFLRRESLSRMIWEKLEEWGWQDPNRAIARAVSYYPFDKDFDLALERMTDDELDTLLEHELGEVMIGRELGPDWEVILAALPRSRAEYQLRAIRDHLVDCTRTLPRLLDEGREAALHFYFANFTTMRKAIFPTLAEAYQKWLASGNNKALREACLRGQDHWMALAQRILQTYREQDTEELHHHLTISDEEISL